MSAPDWRDMIARALHEAHKPYCDYTYAFEHPMSSREVYEALSAAVLDAIEAAGYRLHRDHDWTSGPVICVRCGCLPGEPCESGSCEGEPCEEPQG